jgi:hypothetical protein
MSRPNAGDPMGRFHDRSAAPACWGTQQGSILLGTVLAMLLLTVLALSLAMNSTLEGKVALNHYALVKALYVADAGIDGVRKELTDYVNANGGWQGTWNTVLAAKGNLCAGGASVAFNAAPSDGATWIRTGSTRTLFIRDNDVDDVGRAVPWENGNACTDTDGLISAIADGRIAASAGAFGASKRVAVDLVWQAGGGSGGWDNAIQGGGPGGGALISGNGMVYGGVALNAPGGGVVWNMGGTSGIRNNYQNGAGAPSSEQLRATTRALLNPALLALGDVALNAGFWIDHGTVAFGGGASAGLPQGATTDRKQTLDLAFANDFDPAGVTQIHADRTGALPQSVPPAPLLSSLVGDGDSRTWEVMLNQDGLHITAADLTVGCLPQCTNTAIDGYSGTAVVPPGNSNLRRFCVYAHMGGAGEPPAPPTPPGYPTCTNKTTIAGTVPSLFDLVIDQAPNPNTATLTVRGLIVFDNYGTGQGIRLGGLNGGGPESLGAIVYTGSAAIFVDDASPNNCTGATVCAGRLTIAADIKTPTASFPTAVNPPVYPPAAGTVNTIGFMADAIGIGYGADGASTTGVGSAPAHSALFYAQSRLYLCKDTEVFGSLLSAQVNISCQVPKIAAVKSMSWFLPRGLVGSGSGATAGTAVVVRWREVARP